jgi:3'-phosphoadenosine 5'-phosphosulfate sulfotransferase (PAPS reductase)/FAD synthetase
MIQGSLLTAFLEKEAPCFIFSSSYGNDSVAQIQWASEHQLLRRGRCVALYCDTGWAAPWWPERVSRLEAWAESLGFDTARTASIGLLALVERERGWPRHGMQFCTEHLKVRPAQEWMASVDPGCTSTVVIGKRRAESVTRQDTPEYIESSPAAGFRRVWHPLFEHSDLRRDELLKRAGVEPLPHRSDECFPCVNAGKNDIRRLTEERIQTIEGHEHRLGHTRKGAPRTMFRPAKKMGATGIRQIVRWAKSPRGKFDLDDGTGPSETETGCDGGWCA